MKGPIRSRLLRQAASARSVVVKRGYATPSAATFSLSESNGFKVACQSDTGSPTSALSVVLKAGPRYEPEPGLSHALKNFVFRATNKRSALRIIRETEIYGGVLSTSLTRENIFLTAEFLKGDEQYFAEILGDALSEAKFALYEYTEDVVPQLQIEYHQSQETPAIAAMDAAHTVAFRSGLGNSLYASPHLPVPYNLATSFARAALSSPSNSAILASNVEASTLKSLIGDYFTSPSQKGAGSTAPVSSSSANYYGGESRFPSISHHSDSHDHGHVLVAFKGAAQDKASAYVVLQHLLGGEPAVKWSQGATGLAAAAQGAKAFNLSYSDAGLIGFTVDAPTSKTQDIASKAVAEFKKVAKGGLKQEDVKAAIAKAKFTAATAEEHRLSNLEHVGSSVMSYGSVSSLSDTFAALDKITGDDITKAAEAALKSRPTFVAVGNTHKLPYISDIGL